jgi:Protein of unknown function (DUF669)
MTELSTVLSEAFDTPNEEGSPDFEPLPKGSYVASIIDAKAGPLKSGKGQAVSITWEVNDDKYCGRLIFDRVIYSHENPDAMRIGKQRLKDVAVACGWTEPLRDLTVLHGKPCMISVKIESDPEGEYAPKNRVTRVKKIEAAKPNGGGKADFNDPIPF